MSKRAITVNIEVVIDDEEQLRTAAAARAKEEGLDTAAWEEMRDGPEDDLIMLLDPGMLDGCSIIDSTTEEFCE